MCRMTETPDSSASPFEAWEPELDVTPGSGRMPIPPFPTFEKGTVGGAEAKPERTKKLRRSRKKGPKEEREAVAPEPAAPAIDDDEYRQAVAAPSVDLSSLGSKLEPNDAPHAESAGSANGHKPAQHHKDPAPGHSPAEHLANFAPPAVNDRRDSWPAAPAAASGKNAAQPNVELPGHKPSAHKPSAHKPSVVQDRPVTQAPVAQPTFQPPALQPPLPAPAAQVTQTEQSAPAQPAEPARGGTEISAPKRYSGRIGGLDIARCFAIFGMFYAHVGPQLGFEGIGGVLNSLPDGRSSILFALLAGISLSILTGRNVPYGGERMRTSRLRIFGRSVALLVIAGILSLFGTPVAIILGCYAAWFITCLPMTRWHSRRLFTVAGSLAILGPVVLNLSIWTLQNLNLWPGSDNNGYIMDVFITGMYPGVVYMVYVLAGMGLGRIDLTRKYVQTMLVAAGSVLMIVGYGSAWIFSQIFRSALAADPVQVPVDPDLVGIQPWIGLPFPDIHLWAGAEPHTHTIFEAVGSGGFGITFLGICLLIGGLARTALYPVAAVGSMSLSAYSAHVIAIAFNLDWNHTESWFPILALIVASLVLCSAWKLVSKRGPLEWVMWKVSMMVSHTPEEE